MPDMTSTMTPEPTRPITPAPKPRPAASIAVEHDMEVLRAIADILESEPPDVCRRVVGHAFDIWVRDPLPF